MAEKLVRDLVPQRIAESGAVPIVRVATSAELPGLLADKLAEEVAEYRASGDVAELADVAEALFTLVDALDVDLDDLRRVKLVARGGFGQRLVWCGNREVGRG